MKKRLIYLFIVTAVTSCTHHGSGTHSIISDYEYEAKRLEHYETLKSKFPQSFTEHFPYELSREGSMYSSEDIHQPHLGIVKIDYNVGPPSINRRTVSRVNLKCIIPFSTISTLTKLPKGRDHLVIPLIEVEARFKGFDNSFKFYSVKQTDLSGIPKYPLNPNRTSIESLKHGYSKGIAYSSSSRIAVYWAIVW